METSRVGVGQGNDLCSEQSERARGSQVGSHVGGVGITPTYSSWFNRSNAAELVKKLDPFIRTHYANSVLLRMDASARSIHRKLTRLVSEFPGWNAGPLISNQLRYRSREQATIAAPCATRGLHPRLLAHDRQFVSVTVKPSQ